MRKGSNLLASVSTFVISGFNNQSGWKLDDDGKLVLDANGDPIYIDGEGREVSVGAGKISQLNGEARTHRIAKEEAEAKLAQYEGIDPEAARQAMAKVAQLDGKELIDAGKVDELTNQIKSQYEDKITERDAALAERDAKINSMIRETAFTNSEFIRDRVALPRDFFQAKFAENFKIEDGRLVPYGPDGKVIYSKKNIGGEPADFDEALEIMISAHRDKDMILKAPDKGGTGGGSGGGGRQGSRSISRAEFSELPPNKQAEVAAQAGNGEMVIVD